MRRSTMAAGVGVVALAVGGVVAGGTAATRALFSDTADGTDSGARAASVELGSGGGTVKLEYPDLRPGRRQVVDLTVSYVGSVPADVTLEIAPSGSSALCVQRRGQWQARRGGAVTVAIGSAAPVSYCELLNGRALPLASAVSPASEQHVDVAVMLSKDAGDGLRGRAVRDMVTIQARGEGFTDHATGTIGITTAGPDRDRNDERAEEDAARNTAGPTARGDASDSSTAEEQPVTLPAECEEAGMELDRFEDVIVLGPGQHIWKAPEQRGQGAGPFLVVGADGDDEIVGSEHADCLVGGGGRDSLAGGAGDDVLIGGDEADLLDGGPGNDWLVGGAGDDDLRGGEGDRIDDEAPGSGTGNSPEPDSPGTETSEPDSADPAPPSPPTGQAEAPGDDTAVPPAAGEGEAGGEDPPVAQNMGGDGAPPPNSPAGWATSG